jgi:uncharacterized protein (DUF302 family)
MSYYFARMLDLPFDEAVAATREALKAEGFGVITEIDVQATMKTKLDEDYPPYLILGACNPRLALEALKLENKVGTMLPCNVIVRDAGGGKVEVAAIDPQASMQAIDNDGLKEKAAMVGDKLRAAMDRL